MTTSPPTLGYEDSLERDDISIEHKGGVLRIIIPRQQTRKTSKWPITVGMICAIVGGVFLLAWAIVTARRGDPGAWIGFFEYCGGFIAFSFFTRRHQLESTILTLDAQQLRVDRRIKGRRVSNVSYRRDFIGDVHVHIEGEQLVIPIVKTELVQIFVSDDREKTQTIVDALKEELKHNGGKVDRTLPAVMDHAHAIVETAPENREMAVKMIVAVSIVAGIALSILWNTLIGFVVFLVGLMGCGIVLGTQKKDFWT